LTLFSPKATAWHYIFTLVIGTQGIVLLLLFIYKRFQAYQRQQLTTTTSGAETGVTHARSTAAAPEPRSERSEYDPVNFVAQNLYSLDFQVAYDYEKPRRTQSTINRAREFVINKLSSNRGRRPAERPPIPPPTSSIPRGLRRAD